MTLKHCTSLQRILGDASSCPVEVGVKFNNLSNPHGLFFVALVALGYGGVLFAWHSLILYFEVRYGRKK